MTFISDHWIAILLTWLCASAPFGMFLGACLRAISVHPGDVEIEQQQTRHDQPKFDGCLVKAGAINNIHREAN